MSRVGPPPQGYCEYSGWYPSFLWYRSRNQFLTQSDWTFGLGVIYYLRSDFSGLPLWGWGKR